MGSRVVVVGAGVAGFSAAAALRSGGWEGDVVLLDAGDVPHDRPPLSKGYLAGSVDEGGLALAGEDWFAEQSVDLRLRTEVVDLLPAERAVRTAAGEVLRADAVVLAAGGTARAPAFPGSGLPGVLSLRTLADARELRRRVGPGRRLVVVGAGLIGAEVAATARGLGTDVVLLDPADPPLASAVGPLVAAWLHARHAEAGVRTVRAALERVDPVGADGDRVLAVLAGGERVEADGVLVAVGMRPATALAERAGLAVDGGVLVDAAGRTSVPQVLAAGDAARPTGPRGEPLPQVEHWEAARHGGERVAATILGRPAPPRRTPWFWTDRYGHHVEVLGDPTRAPLVRRGRLDEPPAALLAVDDSRLVGAVTVDDARAMRSLRRLADAGLRVDAAALADPATDLRALARGAAPGTVQAGGPRRPAAVEGAGGGDGHRG